MGKWLVTAAAVGALVCLALSAPWWMPGLLSSVADDSELVQALTALVQLGLWILAGLAGFLGIRWARKPSQPALTAQDLIAAATPVEGPAGEGQAPPLPLEQAGSADAAGADAAGADAAGADAGGESAEEADAAGADAAGVDAAGVDAGGERASLESSRAEVPPRPAGPVAQDRIEPLTRPAVPYGAPTQYRAPTQGRPYVGDVYGRPHVGAPVAFNLLALPPYFSGREAEIAQLRRHLLDWSRTTAYRPRRTTRGERDLGGPGRIIAISSIAGMGGAGKTALALHVAHQLAAEGHFSDAQLYIDLRGTDLSPLAPAEALDSLLTALLGPDPGRPQDEEALTHLWRGALQGRQALLVLDDAAGSAQVRPLLPGSPTCAVLITSRRRFSLPGARLLDLGPLSPDEAQALLQALVPRLDNATAGEIAEWCGGLPLALRIAGNYLRANDGVPPAEYAARLADERGRLSHLRDPGIPELDVAASLSSSITQLDGGSRWAWSLLALFPAPFDAAAAAALWGEGVARDAWEPLDASMALAGLRVLRSRSLLAYDPQTRRYDQHDLLRLMARRELEGVADVEGARRRLAYHYLGVARAVDGDQRYLDLDPDWPHLQAALEFARDDADLLSDLVLGLNGYWRVRGLAQEWADWCSTAANACAAADRRREQGVHLGNLGNAYAGLGKPRRAIGIYGQALTASRATGDLRAEGAHLGGLGRAYQAMGDPQQAITYYEQALDIAQEVGDRPGEGACLGDLGRAYARLGGTREAIQYYTQALAIAQALGDQHLEGTQLGYLGQAYASMGAVERAIKARQQALDIMQSIGDRHGAAELLSNLDLLGKEQGDGALVRER